MFITASEVLMRNRLIMLTTILALTNLTARAEAPWEVLAQSPGAIQAAALSASGDLMIQEDLGFTQVSPAGQASRRDLPMMERRFLSPSAGTYASIVYEGSADQPEAASMTIHRADGSVQWAMSHRFLNDVYPANSGAAVAVARAIGILENRVYFFSPQGELVKQVDLPAVGEILVNSASDRVLINSGTQGSLLFDMQGNQLAKLGPAHGLTFSPDGRWAAVLYGPQVNLFRDGKATYTGEPSGEIVRGVVFSNDNAHVAMYTDHALVVMENPSGKILMQNHLETDGPFLYTSIALTVNGGCLAAGVARDLGPSVLGPERHPDGQIRLYNLDGSVCFQKDVAFQHWNVTTPRVSFSADGKYLLVLTRDEVKRAPLASLGCKGGEK
jgi:hypothetical protein